MVNGQLTANFALVVLMLVCVRTLAAAVRHLLGSRDTVLLRSFALLREPIQRALLAAALRQLSARRGSPAPAQLCLQTMRSSVACRGHEMAENKKNMTPE